jgi:hypothetical protein
LTLRAIHAEAEVLLQTDIPYSSVKNAVAHLADGGRDEVRRAAPGVYYLGPGGK